MALGLQEGGVPESPQAGIHDVKIHMRGRYDRLGETVPRRFPRLLAGDEQKPITEGSGRWQLGAEWIASPENPTDGTGDGKQNLAKPFWRGHCADTK